ncbi:BON domain-containing protein [Flavitalea antarctica]
MKTDIQIQKDVQDELNWEPFINASEIGVAVKNGIVTLSGQVDSYAKKLAAENAAKRVSGVKAVAEDIQIGVSPANRRNDTELAQAILNALQWHSAIQEEKIKIKVEDGNVRLEGEVEWEYQRVSAESTIQNLAGIKSILNLIKVKPKTTPTEVKQKIIAAFQRSAVVDAANIKVDVSGARVTLRGKVRSFAEKHDAERAAWAAPGVNTIESKLEVETPELAVEYR